MSVATDTRVARALTTADIGEIVIVTERMAVQLLHTLPATSIAELSDGRSAASTR